ncbi:MAG: potassium/proton antiporter [Alphaproteobacteria bacterium]|nr:potassium/proton antiporter [Alphaproteobacteria bacterium]
MDLGSHLILVGAGLVTLSILAGIVSSRIGAPLLLVFLVLGMLAGEDGPGGIPFDDFRFAYLFGSVALAVILFDGGLRTSLASFTSALWPALMLATVGVIVTAVMTGAAAAVLLDLGWVEALLVGSVVASTDAAAVFFLLHLKGARLKEPVGSTLEIESGLNDPMAIFLTLACVTLITTGAEETTLATADTFVRQFLLQITGGAIAGFIGGMVLVQLINRLPLASGLYAIFALSGALMIFGGTQEFGGSGFLAVYIAGLIVGNRRHRGTLLIARFHDGLSWLCQIAMFLMLGLLVTPSRLIPLLIPALAIAAVLIFVSRPLAVLLCLLPFRFNRRELAFVSWVGLRGAVPIFLATIPVIAGVDHAQEIFAVAYVVVLVSLVMQGWTVTLAARRLGLDLPPRPDPPMRSEIDLPIESDRDMAAYTVQSTSMVARRPLARLPLPEGTAILSVLRDGAMQDVTSLIRLLPGDYVLVITRRDGMATVDRLFAPRAGRALRSLPEEQVGQFTFAGDTPIAVLADQYGFRVPDTAREMGAGAFLASHLWRAPAAGIRLRLGDVELVVRRIEDDRITSISLDVAPAPSFARGLDGLVIQLGPARAAVRAAVKGVRRALGRIFETACARLVRGKAEDGG